MKIKEILTTTVFLFCLPVNSDFRGIVVAHIIEPNGHVYRAYDGFVEGGVFKDSDRNVIYFEQERGHRIAISGKEIVTDNSTGNKYYMAFTLLESDNDNFQANLEFFYNRVNYDDKLKEYNVVSQSMKTINVEGVFNTENTYLFTDKDLPNYRVRINIDKLFSKDEIIKRHEKQE